MTSATAPPYNLSAPGPVHLANLGCTSSEDTIVRCPKEASPPASTCAHSQDVYLKCYKCE